MTVKDLIVELLQLPSTATVSILDGLVLSEGVPIATMTPDGLVLSE